MRLRTGLLATALAATLVAGCGGDGGSDSETPEEASRPAPPASDFPATNGRNLEEVLGVVTQQGPVVTPAARVLNEGENRFSFGVFTTAKEPVNDAEVAIYAAPGNLNGPGKAIGPFPARIESVETEPAFRAESTAADPDAPKVIYIADVPLDQPGKWTFAAMTKEGDGFGGSLVATPSEVGQFSAVPAPGDEAPVTDTDVAADNPDISKIDTRVPPSTMHDDNLRDVLGKQPVVLLFATPALCQSRICGPVVDVAEQVKRDSPSDVAWIHQEIYNDNDINKGSRKPVVDYNLPSEPWLFVIDRDGEVDTVIEGAFGIDELQAAVDRVAAS